jgi:hypothetical protein
MRCEDNRWGSDKVVVKRLIMNWDWGMVMFFRPDNVSKSQDTETPPAREAYAKGSFRTQGPKVRPIVVARKPNFQVYAQGGDRPALLYLDLRLHLLPEGVPRW